MLPKKCEQVVMTDSTVSSGCAVRGKQALLNPIDNRTWIYMEQATDFVRCINGFSWTVSLIHHASQKGLTFL
jgi:hypothetical protein